MAITKKLAELLAERGLIQRRLASNDYWMAKFGSIPTWLDVSVDPAELLAESEVLNTRLAVVIKAINAANSTCTIVDGTSLCNAMIDRDIVARRIAVIRKVLADMPDFNAADKTTGPVLVPVVDIAALHAEADALSKQHRLLNVRIQQANWANAVEIPEADARAVEALAGRDGPI